VTAITYDYSPGLSDEEVLAMAVREKRLLITYNRANFGELIHPTQG
jgi:hypothetical protein